MLVSKLEKLIIVLSDSIPLLTAIYDHYRKGLEKEVNDNG